MGGPILRDKLWFYGSARHWGVHDFNRGHLLRAERRQHLPVPDRRGCRARRVSTISRSRAPWCGSRGRSARGTRSRAYFDEIDKFRGHGITAGNVTDMLTASQIWTSPLYNDAVLKWTSPLTSQLLLEAGFSMNYEQYVIVNQDGINQERGTPAWYAGASRFDINRSTLWGGVGGGQGGRYPDRYNLGASASYVTRVAQHQDRLPVPTGARTRTRATPTRTSSSAIRTACPARSSSTTRRCATRTSWSPTSASTRRIPGRSTA